MSLKQTRRALDMIKQGRMKPKGELKPEESERMASEGIMPAEAVRIMAQPFSPEVMAAAKKALGNL